MVVKKRGPKDQSRGLEAKKWETKREDGKIEPQNSSREGYSEKRAKTKARQEHRKTAKEWMQKLRKKRKWAARSENLWCLNCAFHDSVLGFGIEVC